MFGEDETLADRGKIRCRGATRRRLKDAQEHLDSSWQAYLWFDVDLRLITGSGFWDR
jgi:hypothetical protein